MTSEAASGRSPDVTVLRTANATDVPALARCARAAYARYVERIGREPAPMVADFTGPVAGACVRVAERAGRLVGYAVVERRPGELHLESVAVLPEHAGQGIGRLLVASVEDEARHLGLPTVTLYTNARMHENLSLYPRLGYVETGRRREHGFDRVYFEKRIEAPGEKRIEASDRHADAERDLPAER